MKEKSKILAIGDLHGDIRMAERLAKKAVKEDVDLVIMAGDIVSSDEHFKGIIGPFARVNKQVLLIPGNHDSFATIDFLSKIYENAKNIHGYSFEKYDLGIFGAGGADFGVNPLTEDEIFSLLKKGHNKIKNMKKKIMVTHMHPEGSKSEFSGFPGSKAIRKAIYYFKPDILINSHIHEAGGIEEKIGDTLVINVSRKERIFEI